MNSEATPEDFISYTKERVNYKISTTLLELPFSTSRSSHKLPLQEMTYRLQAGKPLVLELPSNSRWFKVSTRAGVEIPIPGSYEFTAMVPLQVKGEKEIKWYASNAQKISFGGSKERPRNCFAKLLAYRETGHAIFEPANPANPDAANRIGDRFFVLEGNQTIFVFEVTRLFADMFAAEKVQEFGNNKDSSPKIGAHAGIQSEFDMNNELQRLEQRKLRNDDVRVSRGRRVVPDSTGKKDDDF